MSLLSIVKRHFADKCGLLRNRLIFVWILGQAIGFGLGSQVPFTVVSLMRLPGFGQVSIVWLLFSAIFPFLLSFFALRFSLRVLFVPLVFLKAYSFAYVICCIGIAFGNAGWLMQWLCCFTDTLCTVIFLWFITASVNQYKTQRSRSLLLCVISVIIVVCFDYIVVSPATAALLNR